MAGKVELIDRIAKKAGITQSQAKRSVDEVINGIVELMEEVEEVNIKGFGSWKVKSREARKGRNPQTGETIDIPARQAIAFKPGEMLKGIVR